MKAIENVNRDLQCYTSIQILFTNQRLLVSFLHISAYPIALMSSTLCVHWPHPSFAFLISVAPIVNRGLGLFDQ